LGHKSMGKNSVGNVGCFFSCATCFPALTPAAFFFPRLTRVAFLNGKIFFPFDQNIQGTFIHTWTRPCQNTRRTQTLMVD